MRVLITGATGAVGHRLLRELKHVGHEVRVLTRAETGVVAHAAALHGADGVVVGELHEPSALTKAVAGIDTVFHLAAKLHIAEPDPASRADYWRINVAGTRMLADAARAAGVARFILFSTINVYGPSRPGLTWDEASPLNPDSWYAETKAEAEQIVLEDASGIVLRLSAVYGPRMKGNYVRLVQAIRSGYYIPIGAGRNRRTLVHESDVARAAVAAAQYSRSAGRVYNVTDGHIHELRDIAAAIALSTGRHGPKFYLPAGPVRLAVRLAETGFRVAGRKAPISSATVRKLLEDVAVRGERIREELGVQPQVELYAGWRETLRDMDAAR